MLNSNGDRLVEVTLRRLVGARDQLTPYQVRVDGRPIVAALNESQEVHFNVPPGGHVCVSQPIARSNDVVISFDAGPVASLVCCAGAASVADIDVIWRRRHYMELQPALLADQLEEYTNYAPRYAKVLKWSAIAAPVIGGALAGAFGLTGLAAIGTAMVSFLAAYVISAVVRGIHYASVRRRLGLGAAVVLGS